jgi:hypothetical protein
MVRRLTSWRKEKMLAKTSKVCLGKPLRIEKLEII